MYILIIKDDNDNEKSYPLKSHEINITDDKLLLMLNTDEQSITYEIHADTRANDLSNIEKFISKQLEKTYSTNKPFRISEYLRRMYIFIGDDTDYRQFTANRK